MRSKDNTTDIFDLLITLAKHKMLILKTVLGVTLLALVISLIWPKSFLSSSEVIQNRENIGSLGGLLQNFSSISSGQSKVGGETILVILHSQSLKERLIEHFNLKEVYGEDIKEALFKTLDNVISIEEVREGGFGFNPIVSVKIKVYDESPERAQAMNEFILAELEGRMEALNEKATSENLAIIEQRFQTNQKQLKQAENELNEFQNTYGILEVSKQMEALIQTLAGLKASIVQRQVEVQVLSKQFGENSNQIVNKKQEIQALEDSYKDLVQKSEHLNTDGTDAFYSLYDMPDLLLQYLRLKREVEIQNKIYELLLPQMEQQKLFLKNKGSGLRVIDKPDLPTYKDSPKRAYIVIAGFFFSLFICLFIIYIKELYHSEDSTYKNKIDRLRIELASKKDKT